MRKAILYLLLLLLPALACGRGVEPAIQLPTVAPTARRVLAQGVPPTFTAVPSPTPAPFTATPRPTLTATVAPATPTVPPATHTPTFTLIPPSPTTGPVYLQNLHINDWDISVHRVDVLPEIRWSFGDVERPQGRYLLLFLNVTNQAIANRTFTAFGDLDVRDPNGHHYEEDFVATGAAESAFNTGIPADISPGETVLAIAAYDILGQSAYYELVPGLLADTDEGAVRLNVPTAYTTPPTPRPSPWDTFTGDDSPGSDDYGSGCCKICTKGKACGNTCINASYTCHVGPGCACDG